VEALMLINCQELIPPKRCFIHTTQPGNAKATATKLVGVIHRQDTSGRDNPPPCLSEFETFGTPFARGHIMALELGGPDISANIVPQYGCWQAVGDWRRMEVEIRETIDADVFIADLTYTETFGTTYEVQKRNFENGDKLFHWQDTRIPVRFRVWTVNANWGSGGVKIRDYLAADNDGKDERISALIQALADPPFFDQTIDKMPQIDHDYWRNQMLNGWVRQEYVAYEANVNEIQQKVLLRDNTEPVRKSPRIAGVTPPDALKLNDWLKENIDNLCEKLKKDPDNPAVKGWLDNERTMLRPQDLDHAMISGSKETDDIRQIV
jgi:hypothetical protein